MKWETRNEKWEIRCGKWEMRSGEREVGMRKWETRKMLNRTLGSGKWDSNENSHDWSTPLGSKYFPPKPGPLCVRSAMTTAHYWLRRPSPLSKGGRSVGRAITRYVQKTRKPTACTASLSLNFNVIFIASILKTLKVYLIEIIYSWVSCTTHLETQKLIEVKKETTAWFTLTCIFISYNLIHLYHT